MSYLYMNELLETLIAIIFERDSNEDSSLKTLFFLILKVLIFLLILSLTIWLILKFNK